MVIIIGAGLSGLLTAYRLKKAGIPFKILEARPRIGGRINTILSSNGTPVEMGATWFYDQHENLRELLDELDIQHFEQKMDRSVYYQQDASIPTQIVQIPQQAPSYRIAGGSAALINKLFESLDEKDVFFNQTVKEIKWNKDSIQVIANQTFEASKVVLAIPPKLWAKRISFDPPLPSNLISIAAQTHTWMEDSIKVALSYAQPFWEQEMLPSTLFSNVGPLTEFYDHCDNTRSKYALCGFMNPEFKKYTAEQRKALVSNQVKEVFGPRALDFIDYAECVWSEEENTFEKSADFLLPHQNNGNPIFRNSFFEESLFISSSESSSVYPGYMDGAVHAANDIAGKIIDFKDARSSF